MIEIIYLDNLTRTFATFVIVFFAVCVIVAIGWQILDCFRYHNFRKSLKPGNPVRVDEGDDHDGLYIIKKRDDNRVELVKFTADIENKDLSTLETEYTCDILILKPL